MSQLALDWSAPEVKLNSTAPQERAPALQAACWRVLGRLVEGPATGAELEALAGRRFGARLSELRALIYWWAGESYRDPIPYPGSGSNPIYRLAPWAAEIAADLLDRRTRSVRT